jgi:hypothetical protein
LFNLPVHDFRLYLFYQSETPYLNIQLKTPLSESVRRSHNEIAEWTNQNCLIRLWAILESHGFTQPIRKDAIHADTIDLLRRLRHHFAHGTGRYDDEKPAHRKLREKVLATFDMSRLKTEIPLDIDRVLKPMFERCQAYVEDVLSHQNA